MAKEKVEKEKKKGGVLKKVLIVLIVLFVIGSVFGSKEESSGTKTQAKQETESEKEVDVTETPEESKTPEPNTTEMVDYIISKANSDSDGKLDTEKCDEAIAFISDNYPNYFESNEIMEKAMYYGAFLENSFANKGLNDDYANLGQDTVQAIKYVYRGAEKVEDDATQENLNQIKETLDIINSNK